MFSCRSGLTLVECIIVIVVIGIVAALAIPGYLPSSRQPVERTADSALRTLSSAQADFRANDRDWNHINDFWTADVKSLYTLTSAAWTGGLVDTRDPSIRLIELSVAAADADGSFERAGGENVWLANFCVPSTKAGYWFAALKTDLSAGGATYHQDTGGHPPMGRVHNLSRFGFLAFPDNPRAGKYVYIVNEDDTIYRTETRSLCRKGTAQPPGLENVSAEYLNWPDGSTLKRHWMRLR